MCLMGHLVLKARLQVQHTAWEACSVSAAAGAGRDGLRGTRRGVLRAPVCGDRGHRPRDGLESARLRRDAACPAPHVSDRIFSPDLEPYHQIKLSASRLCCLGRLWKWVSRERRALRDSV